MTPGIPNGIRILPEVDALVESMGDRPFLVPEVTPNDGKHRKTQVFHYLRDLCDVGLLAHTNQGYVRCNCGQTCAAYVMDTTPGAGHAVTCPVRIAWPSTARSNRVEIPLADAIAAIRSKAAATTNPSYGKKLNEWLDLYAAHAAALERREDLIENLIDRLLELWHESDSDQPFTPWVGITDEQYAAYVTQRWGDA